MSADAYNFSRDPHNIIEAVYIWHEGQAWGFPIDWHVYEEVDEDGEYLMAYPELYTTELTLNGHETSYDRFTQVVGINAYDVLDELTSRLDEMIDHEPINPYEVQVDYDISTH